MTKLIQIGTDVQLSLINGIRKLAEVTCITLGPKSWNVALDRKWVAPTIIHDGISIAKEIELPDPFENMGAQLVKEASEQTVDKAGDGPQPLYSNVLTPNGFVQMGNLKIGDEICGTEGTTQKVIGIFPKGEKEIYRVKFSDGRTVECCKDHLWNVTKISGAKKTIPLYKIKDNFYKDNKDGSKTHRYYTPSTYVEFYSHKEKMPLDSYLVGLLLGDGSLRNTGSIELSLGKNKEHILDKIKLPDGIFTHITYVESKNYFRVKLNGKTSDGRTMKNILDSMGILDVLSHTKHIPHAYLYSSIEEREKLLQGLLDTDGYINSRGLFEFSTVSHELAQNFTDLIRSLGKQTTISLYTREKDKNSYSNNPIFRMYERKGYKYGLKIIDIEATGKFTKMQCIKVSNSNNLYITDDFVVTHNTTTSVLLAWKLIEKGIKHIENGANPIMMKDGIDKAISHITSELTKLAIPVKDDDIEHVATIASANPVLGKIIGEAIQKIGPDGVVTIEDGMGEETTVEYKEGMMIDEGFGSPHFITNPNEQVSEIYDPLILYTDMKIDSQQDLSDFLDNVLTEKRRNIVIIADEFQGLTLPFLVDNHKAGFIRCLVVKAPSFGLKRIWMLEDMAAITGGTVITRQSGRTLSSIKLEELGRAEKIWADKDVTKIIDGRGNPKLIRERISSLKNQVLIEKSEFEQKNLKERIARLSSGAAIIHVGAHTSAELKDKKERIEDAIQATRAAVAEGIVAGGGITLYNLKSSLTSIIDKEVDQDIKKGVELVQSVLDEPLKKILSNAGKTPEIIMEEIRKLHITMENRKGSPFWGYDVVRNRYGDMVGMGIVDAVRVTKQALINAGSVSGMILTIGALVSDEEETSSQTPPLS